MKDLTKGKPMKVILLFGIPILIGVLFNEFYSLADTRIIGSYLGEDALAATGSISTLGDFINRIAVGFSNGFGILTAQFYGRGVWKKVRRNFYISMELGAVIAIAVTVICHACIGQFMNFLNVSEGSRGMAGSYILIIINGMIFSMLYNILAANFRAIGDAYTPLIFLIVSALMNVGLDILLVGYTSMGVSGAALATILAQAISAFGAMIYLWFRYPQLRPEHEDFLPDLPLIRELMSNGTSMALMSCLVAFGTLSLQTSINTFGNDTIVAHTAARKITQFFMLPNFVYSSCLATYCGQNYGAGRMDRIRIGIRDTLITTTCWAVLVQIASYTISPYLVMGVTGTDTEAIITTACTYLKVDTLFYVVCHAITILRSSLQGMGDKTTPVISSGLELTAKVLVAGMLAPRIGYWGIIWAEPISWTIMVIPLIISTVRILKGGMK